jgi:uncharacterized membrane protein
VERPRRVEIRFVFNLLEGAKTMTVKSQMRTLSLAAAVAMALGFTSSVWAQAAAPKLDAKGEAAFAKADKNGDGKLSKDEAGPEMAAKFDALDVDKDGALSKAEFAAMPQ